MVWLRSEPATSTDMADDMTSRVAIQVASDAARDSSAASLTRPAFNATLADAIPGVRRLAMQRVLVIEDEPDIAALVALHLRDMNLFASIVNNGRQGLQCALTQHWDLIVLDLSLPELDGIDICHHLRMANHYTPVLMLTARTTEQDRVIGLDAGADDYLTKPFSVVELRARIRAILRRVKQLRNAPSQPQNVVRIGELEVDLDARLARMGSVALTLTAREFDLLAHFVRSPGRVFSRTQLLDQVWGLNQDAYEHTVSSHINRLRAKLEPDAIEPRYLLTVWGVGYRFRER